VHGVQGSPALHVGGSFRGSPAGDNYLATWAGCTGTSGPWTDVGGGKPGTGGLTPLLEGEGPLTDGSFNALHLSQALPSSSAHVILGLSAIRLPFKGGTLVPAPDLVLGNVPVSAAGTLSLSFRWPSGIPAGLSFWFQSWIADDGVTPGVSASNALRAESQ
jgi:hypothetical protein